MVLSNWSARMRGSVLVVVVAVLAAITIMAGAHSASATPVTTVTPTAPTRTVVCGPNNDVVTTPGVEYNNDPQVFKTTEFTYIIDPHGTDVPGTITVAAAPNAGYAVSQPVNGNYVIEVSGNALWTFVDQNTACGPTHVTVVAPTSTQPTCSVAGTVTPVNTSQYTFAASGTASATYETATAVGNVVLDGQKVFGPYDLTKSTTGCNNPPPAPTYVVNAWKLGPLSTPSNFDASTLNGTTGFKDDQTDFKTSGAATTVNLNVLDGQLAPNACYQIDGYKVGSVTTALLAGGPGVAKLHGPNNPPESLAFGAPGLNGGNPWKYICIPPAPITCTVTGTPYTESGDHPPVPTVEGWDFRSFHDGHATSVVIPISGNAQGITSLSFTDTNVVGYGMFSRLIFNLSADGGPSYASFSVSPGNTIDQSAVAGVGSNSHLIGKTIAQVATAYPHNSFTGWGFQTGSSYPGNGGPTSDGATLTGYSGDCGNTNFVPTKPANDVSHTSTATVDCASLTQTTVTTTTSKPYIWNASSKSYVLDTVSANWTVTSSSAKVALTSDQIAKNCPSSTPTPSATPTASTPPVSSGGANTDVFGSAPAASHNPTPQNWGWVSGILLAFIVACFIGFIAMIKRGWKFSGSTR